MTFNPITGDPKNPLKVQVDNQADRDRAEVLIRRVLNTPEGKELVGIWKKQLIHSPVFNGGSDIASLNNALGVNKCIQRFIKIAESRPKPKKKETENE